MADGPMKIIYELVNSVLGLSEMPIEGKKYALQHLKIEYASDLFLKKVYQKQMLFGLKEASPNIFELHYTH